MAEHLGGRTGNYLRDLNYTQALEYVLANITNINTISNKVLMPRIYFRVNSSAQASASRISSMLSIFLTLYVPNARSIIPEIS